MDQHRDQVASAARLSLIFNVGQTLLKIVGAVLTGSVSFLSEAVHSSSDVLSSVVSYFSVKVAGLPPDDEHPYGYGKIDTLAGLGESVMLVVFAVYSAIMSIVRLISPAPIEQIDTGIGILVGCGVIGLAVWLRLRRVASKTHSLALESNAQHISVDLLTTLGVIAALILSRVTGWKYADPAVGLGLAVWLGWSSVKLVHRAFHSAIDTHIDPPELEQIKAIFAEESELLGYHSLRTRHSGAMHFIDVHLEVPHSWTVVQAHDLAQRVERKIEAALAPAVCTIQVDPAPQNGRPR